MTTKELLYIEDALSHEKYLKEKCHTAAESTDDPAFAECLRDMEEKHKRIYNSFYALL